MSGAERPLDHTREELLLGSSRALGLMDVAHVVAVRDGAAEPFDYPLPNGEVLRIDGSNTDLALAAIKSLRGLTSEEGAQSPTAEAPE